MEARSLTYLAAACGGELVGATGTERVQRISTDSRTTQTGDLFIALKGERFDAHEFLGQVAERGVTALLIEQSQREKLSALKISVPAILVADTKAALGKIAATYRRDFAVPVVAVAGSNGKTTTKELLASILAQRFRTVHSEASFNNDIGVPLTLLKLDAKTEAAVLEVGTNHPGELAPLVRIIAPQTGVITSIGREHLEFFGDVQGVADEEGWLAELLPANGTLFVNGDSPEIHRIIARARAQVVMVGAGERNEWRLVDYRMDDTGGSFTVAAPESRYAGKYRVNLLGQHQAINALLAVAVGASLGLSREEIEVGLVSCPPPKMRLQVWVQDGVRILDDSYNANADSMAAALQTLSSFPNAVRRIAVLGDMAELGETSAAAHTEIGQRAAASGLAHLFAVGKRSGLIADAARNAGLNAVSEFTDVAAGAQAVKEFVRAGDCVLVKASRSTRLERISATLRGLPVNWSE
jgi:UDP-N-acetylmuramoyl-tripeptide--D-alanyl-D-alanine ligase